MKIHPYAEKITPTVTAWRHHIHKNPEIGLQEYKTADFIKKQLDAWGLLYQQFIDTGIVATLKKGTSKRSIAFRADIDALPMTEANDIPHKSTQDRLMHGCGHDGHTAMLLGAVDALHHVGAFDGTVHCIFQPGEEGLFGAKKMIQDGMLIACPMDEVYAIHNWPELPFGTAGAVKGGIMAGGGVLKITIHGQGGHGALPHACNDPVPVASQLVTALQSIISRNISPTDSAVLSACMMQGGDMNANSVIPDSVQIVGTVRFFKQSIEDFIVHRIKTIAKGFSTAFECKIDVDYEPMYRPTINHDKPTEYAGNAIGKVLGKKNIFWDLSGAMTGEDFCYMLQQIAGNYLWLGAGNPSSGLHSTTYDFNDDLIPIGISYWLQLAQDRLPIK